MFRKRLADSAILNIGRGLHDRAFFPRALEIVKHAEGQALRPAKVRAGAVEPPVKVAADKTRRRVMS